MAGQFPREFRPERETDNTSTPNSPARNERSGSRQGKETVEMARHQAEQSKARGEKPDNERIKENMMFLAAKDAAKANEDLNADAKHRRKYFDAWYKQRAKHPVEPHMAQSDQQAKDAKEARLKEARLKKVDLNLATRFRNNERGAHAHKETNIYEEAKILDDYIGRVASGQRQTYTIDQAFKALESITIFLDNPPTKHGGGDSARTAFKKHLESVWFR